MIENDGGTLVVGRLRITTKSYPMNSNSCLHDISGRRPEFLGRGENALLLYW